MKLPEIIGIAGTNGAGKDTLADFLTARSGYKNTSTSDVLRMKLEERGVVRTRENMHALGTELRRKFGNGVLGNLLIERYQKEKEEKGYKGLVISSMRHPAIAEVIKREGGVVIWLDGDRRTRYERIRINHRNGRIDDDVTYEEFCAQEDAELHPSNGDSHAADMEGVRRLADMTIMNNFPNLEVFEGFLDEKFEL